MEIYHEQPEYLETGILYPFSSHLQKHRGNTPIARAHWHNDIEILYGLSGNVKVHLDCDAYNLSPGSMLLISSKEVHSIYGDSSYQSSSYIVVKFAPEVLYTTSSTVFEAKYILPFVMSNSTHQRLFAKEALEETFLPSLLHEILEEYEEKSYGFELAIRTHIGRIFLWILRRWHQEGIHLNIENELSQATILRLQTIFDYVDQNYANPIDVEDVAKLCNMSYSYFSRFFKANMKKSFSQYLNYVRINKAEELLTTTDLNITEIAQQTGFSTSSYFIQQFKHYKDISPKQFKNHFIVHK